MAARAWGIKAARTRSASSFRIALPEDMGQRHGFIEIPPKPRLENGGLVFELGGMADDTEHLPLDLGEFAAQPLPVLGIVWSGGPSFAQGEARAQLHRKREENGGEAKRIEGCAVEVILRRLLRLGIVDYHCRRALNLVREQVSAYIGEEHETCDPCDGGNGRERLDQRFEPGVLEQLFNEEGYDGCEAEAEYIPWPTEAEGRKGEHGEEETRDREHDGEHPGEDLLAPMSAQIARRRAIAQLLPNPLLLLSQQSELPSERNDRCMVLECDMRSSWAQYSSALVTTPFTPSVPSCLPMSVGSSSGFMVSSL